MLQSDEDDKRYRSIRLCQLVCDRQIDSEIGHEIRKLLEKGVLIDFRDQNRNKKTALHLAVEKCDITCVKFLLQFRPNLDVKDEHGRTPIDSSGDQRIRNVLINSTVDVVDESYIEVFDFKNLTRHKIEAIKSRPTFKILKLINCPSVEEVWMKLNDNDYTTLFNESSHLFFIAIETEETSIDNDPKTMKKALNLRRPMIVQLSSSNCRHSKIYSKDDEKDFVEITDTPQITQAEFDEAVQAENECNLKLLVAALRSNLFGQFTGDLLTAKLSTNENQSEAVNQFARSNALCHRLLKLFDKSQPQVDRIFAAISFNGDQSLLALLDLPFEPKGEKLKLNEYQQDILSIVNDRDYNLLMMAAEFNNLDAVKLLLRCGCDFNYANCNENRASDICWEMKAFECLAELIEAGSPYPYHFSADELDESSEAHEGINKMIEAINSFHEHIKQGEIEEVKMFITSHPHIKHAFDTNNKCALTVALQTNHIDIFSLLMSEGFEPGADDEYYTVLSKSKFKNEIRNSHRKYFKEAFNPHLKRLLDKSKLSFGSKDQAKCSMIIQRMFDKLNEIDELIPILKICSLSDKLRIVFDFNCDSVVEMDPSGSSAPSVVYPIGGFVYVGAKNHATDFFKVIGALIHELTHYAMKLTYDNSCKPYDVGAIAHKNQFDNVTKETKKICDDNPSTDSIVTTVFSCYTESVWHQELIVRVPQLLAHYKMNPKALKAAERNTSELFHFYRDRTLRDVERESKVLLQKYLIDKINNQTGIARKLENLNVQFENVVIDLKPLVYVITSNAPKLTLAMLNQFDFDDSHIFVSLEQVAIGNILEKITKVNAKESSTALIVDCIGQVQKYPESLRKLIKNIKNIKTVALVMAEAESLKVKENFPKVESKTFVHKWNELTESSKVYLLDKNVIFQGVNLKLNELVERSSKAMKFFPLSEILDCKDFKIGHELHQSMHTYYIPRKFLEKGQSNAKSFEELSRDEPKIGEKLLKVESRMGAMIISDEAGSGKSVALFEIAKNLHVAYPDRWVLFVDLKLLIGAFKNIEDYGKIKAFPDFISENILKNEPEFDRELFSQMFRSGKTFVLLDGFDEICPNYKKLLLHVLKLFEPRSGNQLYITTRPHLEADLEATLGRASFKLEVLSKESQTSFLRKYWQSVGFKISHEDFKVLSSRLLEKFSKITNFNLIGFPLLLRMTAEIFDDTVKENLLHKVDSFSIASVFRQFVEKYLARWINNKNEISQNEALEFQMAGGVLGVYHNIAIKHIFDGEFTSFEVDEYVAEKISRVGLFRYDNTEKTFQFVHQTFAEYFVADFIWFHLNKKNRNPTHDCRKAIEVLVEVVENYSNFEVVQTFLDQSLMAMNFSPNEAFCKSVAKCLSEIVRSKNSFYFLRRSLCDSHENLSSLLLSVVKHAEKDVLLKVLQSKTTLNDAALHIAAAHKSSAVVSTLCDIITSCTDNPKEFYQDECDSGNVLLTAARHNDEKEVLETLCANLNSVLTKDEIKIMFQQKDALGQNIIAIVSRYNKEDVLLELISLLSNYLSHDEIKSLLRAVNDLNRNFFQKAVENDTSESLKLKFEIVKTNFTAEEQKIFFHQPAAAPNIFHWATVNCHEKVFETIFESTRDVLSIVEIKSMLMEKDPEGSNMLHNIAACGNLNSLNGLNVLLREHLAGDEIRSLLLEVNAKGQNCFRLAANNAKLNFQAFCEIIGKLLPIEDQTRLLHESSHEIDIIRLACGSYTNEIVSIELINEFLAKDRQGRNAFQEAAVGGNVDTWNKLISFAQARFSMEEMKSFLFSCDINGKGCLELPISISSRENMIGAVCETIKTVGLSVKDQKMLLKRKDSANRNVFHHAAASFDASKCFSLFDGLSTILSRDEIREMLKEKNSEGVNFLLSSNFVDGVSSHDLLKFLQGILTNDEIKELLFDVDCEERNLFQCTVEFSSKSEIKSSSTAIKKILCRNDQRKFFGTKNPNVFHLAVRNPHSGIFSTLHECLKEVLTRNEIKSLVNERTSESKNILLLLCQQDANYDNEKRLHDFLKFLKDVFDSDELKNFLTSSDNHGSNCLLIAAQFKKQFFLKEIFSFIQSELSIDDQRYMIQKCDSDGNSIFECASVNAYQDVSSYAESYAKEILTENQISKLLKKYETMPVIPESTKNNQLPRKDERDLVRKTLHALKSQAEKPLGTSSKPLHPRKHPRLSKKWAEAEEDLIKSYCTEKFARSVKLASKFLPHLENELEVRPISLECFKGKKSVNNEDGTPGEVGSFCPNEQRPCNLGTSASTKGFEIDENFNKNSELSNLNIKGIEGKNKPGLETDNSDFPTPTRHTPESFHPQSELSDPPPEQPEPPEPPEPPDPAISNLTEIALESQIDECFKFLTKKSIGENYPPTFTGMMEKYAKVVQNKVLQKIILKFLYRKEVLKDRKSIDELFINEKYDERALLPNEHFLIAHQLFPEFLAAYYLFFNLFLNENYNDIAIRLLEICVERPSNFLKIRKYLDEAFELLNSFYSAHRKTASSNAKRIFYQKNLHNIFHAFIKDDLSRFVVNVSFLLLDCESSPVLQDLWLFKDAEQERNTIMIAARYLSPKFLEDIFSCARNVKDLDAFMFHRDSNGRTVFFHACQNKKYSSVGIFDVLIKSLTLSDENLEKLLNLKDGKNNEEKLCCLKFDEIRKIILEAFGETFLFDRVLPDDVRKSFSLLLDENITQSLPQYNNDSEEFYSIASSSTCGSDSEEPFYYLGAPKDQIRPVEKKTALKSSLKVRKSRPVGRNDILTFPHNQIRNESSDDSHVENKKEQEAKDSEKTESINNSSFCSSFRPNNQKSCINFFSANNYMGDGSDKFYSTIAYLAFLAFLASVLAPKVDAGSLD